MLRTRAFSMAAGFAPLVAIAPIALAQESQSEEQMPIVEACRGPEHRQFDFWLGDYEVTNKVGAVVGNNRITRVSGGCGLQESWRGSSGTEGTSLNWFDPQNGHWNQVWVGSGVYLRLVGGLENGNMVLSGERQTPQGVVEDRITWMPLDNGRVRQVWEMSRDSGGTWQVVFDGMYTRR